MQSEHPAFSNNPQSLCGDSQSHTNLTLNSSYDSIKQCETWGGNYTAAAGEDGHQGTVVSQDKIPELTVNETSQVNCFVKLQCRGEEAAYLNPGMAGETQQNNSKRLDPSDKGT